MDVVINYLENFDRQQLQVIKNYNVNDFYWN